MGNKQPLRHWRAASSALLIGIVALSWAAPSSCAGQDIPWLDHSRNASRVIGKVHEQETCLYDSVFAAVTMLEGQQAKHCLLGVKNRVRPLSYQMLIDCLSIPCDGEVISPLQLFAFIKNNGIALASAYSGQSADQCKPSSQHLMRGLFDATVNDRPTDEYLVDKLHSFGPIMVGIDSQLLIGDPLDQCTTTKVVDQYITLVGYGTYDGQKYYKYKNSFGEGWGDKGYGRIRRVANCMPFKSAVVLKPSRSLC